MKDIREKEEIEADEKAFREIYDNFSFLIREKGYVIKRINNIAKKEHTEFHFSLNRVLEDGTSQNFLIGFKRFNDGNWTML